MRILKSIAFISIPALSILFSAAFIRLQADNSPHPPVIGFLSTGPQTYHAAFWDGLAAAGYIDGKNIKVNRKIGSGSPQDLPRLVDELAASDVKAIVATNTASVQAVLNRTSAIPIVMVTSATPLELQFIDSYARPGRSITGVMMPHPESLSKSIQLMQEVVPTLKRLAVLYNSTNPVHPAFLSKIKSEGELLAIDVLVFDVKEISNWSEALSQVKQADAHGLIVLVDPFINRNRDHIVKYANAYHLPAIYPFKEFARAGGLISYGVEFADLHYRSANFVDQILKGRKASELPVEQASRLELTVNIGTAEALGLTLPPTLLLRADELID